ncbi:MAG: N5-glutamine methyltransferase family protein, partial [Acidimicrobiales bacterium]
MAEAGRALGRRAEARWTVERASGLEGAALVAALDEPAAARAAGHCRAMVGRRLAGEPLQYVLGSWGFRRLDLLVDGRVLIPRPETEQVVDVARAELARLRAAAGANCVDDSPRADRSSTQFGAVANCVDDSPHADRSSTQFGGRGPGWASAAARGTFPTVAVDLGTGSGAIALALAAEEPGLTVWATDVSAGALAVAGANLAGLGGRAATRVHLARGDWYEALPGELRGRVCLVVSNPPYVADAELASLPAEVAGWEPHGALLAGATGLEGLAAVLRGALEWLARPGAAVIELAPHQAGAATSLAAGAGFGDVAVHPDLAGRPRVLVARTATA